MNSNADKADFIPVRVCCGIVIPAAIIIWAIVVLKENAFTYIGKDVWPQKIYRTVAGDAARIAGVGLLCLAAAMHIGFFWMVRHPQRLGVRSVFLAAVIAFAVALWAFIAEVLL